MKRLNMNQSLAKEKPDWNQPVRTTSRFQTWPKLQQLVISISGSSFQKLFFLQRNFYHFTKNCTIWIQNQKKNQKFHFQRIHRFIIFQNIMLVFACHQSRVQHHGCFRLSHLLMNIKTIRLQELDRNQTFINDFHL